jgi:ribose transport system substrate-binding protein
MRSVRLWFLLALLAGCHKAVDTKKPGASPAASSQSRVAFVSNNSEDFWTIAEKGTRKAEKDFDVRVEFKMPSPGTAEVQRQLIEDLLNLGVKGIAVSANDAKNTVDFFKNQVSTKVPLIMQDNDVPDPTARRCYIGTNNYLAGRACGELVAKAVPDGGKIAIFVGRMDAQNAVERRQGVLDFLMMIDRKELGDLTPSDAANIKLGDKYVLVTTKTDDVSAEKCQEYASQLLVQDPKIACFVGLWAYNPPALIRAAKKAKQQNKDVQAVVVGFDEDFETLDAIKTGDCYATVVQNPFEFGYQSIKILAGLARGDESVLKDRKDIDSQGRIFIPHRIIGKDNVDAFYTELKALKGK